MVSGRGCLKSVWEDFEALTRKQGWQVPNVYCSYSQLFGFYNERRKGVFLKDTLTIKKKTQLSSLWYVVIGDLI